MTYYDVFNGDADGICALHQMRLATPLNSTLVTGVKRDISLLKNVPANSNDVILVLDISYDKNRDDVQRLLEAGSNIQYFDHHFAGDITQHEKLRTYINTGSNVCTSLLVNKYLNQRYLSWAVTAAFGDNLHQSAIAAANPLNLKPSELQQLELLGTCINYNGYGASLDDLIFKPDDLYRIISHYENPFEFIQIDENYKKLKDGYEDDIKQVKNCAPMHNTASHSITQLPNEKWARRVSGVYANQLATENPDRAHAILTDQGDGNFLVSVRAPLNNKTGADELCRKFESGGGRKAAAGINKLPAADYDVFFEKFIKAFI